MPDSYVEEKSARHLPEFKEGWARGTIAATAGAQRPLA